MVWFKDNCTEWHQSPVYRSTDLIIVKYAVLMAATWFLGILPKWDIQSLLTQPTLHINHFFPSLIMMSTCVAPSSQRAFPLC